MKYQILLFSIFLVACGNIKTGVIDPSDPKLTLALNYTFDQMKWITPEITETQEPQTIEAENYSIDSDHRLLFRLKKLKKESSAILQEHPVLIRLFTHNSNMNSARINLLLCPMTTQWMMLATWQFAHPFRHGEWRSKGGDFDYSSCLNALDEKSPKIVNDTEKKFCEGSNILCFDIRSIIEKYQKSRGIDFGFILINEGEDPIIIRGDGSYQPPEIFWRKLR